jgi:hypothetical protein
LVFANTSVKLSSPGRGSAAPRLLARSRTDDFADRKILCCHGGGSDAETFTGCLPSERLRGGLCPRRRERLQAANCRERYQRAGNTGHSILHRCLYFIGAHLSGPSGGDCTLPRSVFLWVEQLYSDLRSSRRSPYLECGVYVLLRDAKRTRCAVRPDSSGGRCRVPVRSETGRYSRASFTKPSGLTSKTGTRAVSSSEAGGARTIVYYRINVRRVRGFIFFIATEQPQQRHAQDAREHLKLVRARLHLARFPRLECAHRHRSKPGCLSLVEAGCLAGFNKSFGNCCRRARHRKPPFAGKQDECLGYGVMANKPEPVSTT